MHGESWYLELQISLHYFLYRSRMKMLVADMHSKVYSLKQIFIEMYILDSMYEQTLSSHERSFPCLDCYSEHMTACYPEIGKH